MSALPHNIEAEQSLLGAVLFDNRLFDAVPMLTPAMFYDPVHGRIYDAALDLVRKGLVADAVSLRNWAKADPGIVEIGGASYLMRLLEHAAPLPSQAVTYAELVREMHQRRETYGAMMRLAGRSLNHDADIVEVIKQGETELSSLIAGGKGWINVREAGEAVVADLDRPASRGIRSGLMKIDRLLGGGFHAPDFIVIAGRPAMGKTALADNIALNVASAGGVVGFFSMEMDPAQIAARALSRRSAAMEYGFAYSDFRSHDRRPLSANVRPLLKRLPETLLIDPTGAQSVAGIEASARNMKRHMGKLDLGVVDYLQLIREGGGKRDNRTQELSEITAGMKSLAKRLGIPIIALSQLSRAVESRDDKRPQLSDLRESGSIEQDADSVLFIYREHYYLERRPPTPQADEDRPSFSTRLAKHDQRMRETRNMFELFTGKNRHGPGGTETLYCDLSMDVISDELTPHASPLRQDGVS